jgi:hypothetical protein
MTTSYQSDQFFNNQNTGETIVRRGKGRLNAPFIYPGNTLRVIDAAGNPTTRTLEKGYIRRLNEFNVDAEDPVLCQFQFNPQFLNQAASFQSGIVNPIYQPIEQLKQPIASMTQFSFRLFFDRSMELNSPGGSVTRAITDNPWELGGPSQVGVLHDINALFRVIGQGISANDVENAVFRARENLAARDVNLDEAAAAEEEARYQNAVNNAGSFFSNNVNVGNTAFILPYPVRIVFSSLYIVEGFVTSTSLEILKFNSAYVPMQAQVTLGVNAIYLGFAKKNTYFTHVLEQSAVTRRNELLQTAERTASDVASIKELFKSLTIKLGRRDVRPNNRTRELIGTGNGNPVIRFNQLFNDVTPPSGFAYTDPRVWASPTDWTDPKKWDVFRSFSFKKNVSEDDPISDLFTSGQLTTIKFNWRASLFGPFPANNDLRRATRNAASADDVRNNPILANTTVRSSNIQSIIVSTRDQWQKLYTPNLTRASTSDPEPVDLPSSLPLPSLFASGLDTTRNWLLLFEGSYTVTLNSSTYSDSSFSALVLNRDATAPLVTTLNFSWSRYDASPDKAVVSGGGGGGGTPGTVSSVSTRPVDGISIAI